MGTLMGLSLEALPLDSHRYTMFPCVTHGTSKDLQCWPTGLTRGSHGFILRPWASHGTPMGYWDSRRAPMGLPFHRTLMDLKCPHETPIGLRQPMRLPWDLQGFTKLADGAPMELPCGCSASMGLPMGLPWILHGFHMGLL